MGRVFTGYFMRNEFKKQTKKQEIKELKEKIATFEEKLKKSDEDKNKYWNQYLDMKRRFDEVMVAKNPVACEYYQDCEVANPECLSGSTLSENCKVKQSRKQMILEAVNG